MSTNTHTYTSWISCSYWSIRTTLIIVSFLEAFPWFPLKAVTGIGVRASSLTPDMTWNKPHVQLTKVALLTQLHCLTGTSVTDWSKNRFSRLYWLKQTRLISLVLWHICCTLKRDVFTLNRGLIWTVMNSMTVYPLWYHQMGNEPLIHTLPKMNTVFTEIMH